MKMDRVEYDRSYRSSKGSILEEGNEAISKPRQDNAKPTLRLSKSSLWS